VTLATGETGLLPVARVEIQGLRVLVYDAKENETSAVQAVHLKNTSDLVLAPGSISVLEAGVLVGQCVFTPMLPGDDQIVTYGLDTTVSVTKACGPKQQTEQICAVSSSPEGVVITRRFKRLTKYTIKSNSAKAVPIFYVDHCASALNGGYAIVTEERAVKRTACFSRFQFALAPHEELVFSVEEIAEVEQPLTTGPQLAKFLRVAESGDLPAGVLGPDVLQALRTHVERSEARAVLAKIHSSAGDLTDADLFGWVPASAAAGGEGKVKLPDGLYEGVKALLAEKEEVAAVQRQRAAAEALTSKIFENQARVRQNLESLVKVQSSGGLVQRYLADLERDEDAIAEARANRDVLDGELQTKKKAFQTQVLALVAEAKKALQQHDKKDL